VGVLDLPEVEGIIPPMSFLPNRHQIPSDCFLRERMGFETLELGMVFIAPGFSGEDFLGQKALPPKGEKAFSIQVLGMKGPEAH
jgi:hypothetical protein